MGKTLAFLTTLAVLAVGLGGPSDAIAESYLSRSDAQWSARDWASKEYGWGPRTIKTACEPTGRAYDPRYDYRKWDCTWEVRREGCYGLVRIEGAPGEGFYYSRRLQQIQCD